jgi:hypothetical protein
MVASEPHDQPKPSTAVPPAKDEEFIWQWKVSLYFLMGL